MEQSELEDLESIGSFLIQSALSAGADDVEVFLTHGKSLSVSIEGDQVSEIAKTVDGGAGIRILVHGALGFSYSNSFRKHDLRSAITKALKSARTNAITSLLRFPFPKRCNFEQFSFEREIGGLQPKELLNNAYMMLTAAKDFDSRISVVDGEVETIQRTRAILNSNDLKLSDAESVIWHRISVKANSGCEATPECRAIHGCRDLETDPISVGIEASKKAVSSLKAKKTQSGNYPVVLTESSLNQLFLATLINALKANYVKSGQSIIKYKDKRMFSDKLTIYDNGLLRGGLLTRRFDDEGTRSQRTLLIDRGVVRNFLSDHSSACGDLQESSGNCSRGGLRSYGALPMIQPTNFQIVPGSVTNDDIIRSLRKAILVDFVQGVTSIDPVSGIFSIIAAPAWQINNGEIACALRSPILAGNMFHLLKRILFIGNQPRQFGYTFSPWLCMGDVKAMRT